MLKLFIILCKIKLAVFMDPVTKDLLTPVQEIGETCGYMSCPVIEENAINVHIVPHTHGELGFTKTFYQHYTGYDEYYDRSKINMKNILDAIVTELWAHDDRKFTFSDFPYFFLWWKNRDETVRRMVFQLIRQGRLYFVGGSWGMSDEATTSYHAIIDLFTYGLRKLNATFLECGRPLVSWQTDAFGHSREFASLMAQMGFDGHFINPISFDDELERMRTKSLEFLWRGSDDLGPDTDIYTHKLFDGYWSPPGFCFGGLCTDPLIISSDSQFLNIEERVNDFVRAVKKRQSPYYTTKHVMVMMGRRNGYHDAKIWFSNIDKLMLAVNNAQRNIKEKMLLYYSTPACYLRAVHNQSPKLSTKQDDFFPMAYDKDSHTSGMFTTRPTIKKQARDIHRYVQMAKQLQVLAKLGNNDARFEDMMWIAGVLQDHNIITGAMRSHVVSYYYNKFLLGKKAALEVHQQAFNKLRGSSHRTPYHICRFNESSCWTVEGNWFYIVVYNPLAWRVTIPIRLPVRKKHYAVYDPKGNIVDAVLMKIPHPVTKLPKRNTIVKNDLVIIAQDLPPLGYRCYYIELIPKKARHKRSIIKKLNKNKKKKYITRQTNMKAEEKLHLDDIFEPDYEYFDELTTQAAKTKILFGNVSRRFGNIDYFDVLTPPTKQVTRTVKKLAAVTLPTVTTDNEDTSIRLSRTSTTSNWETTTTHSPYTVTTYDGNEQLWSTPSTPQPSTTHLNYNVYSRKMAENIYFSVTSSDKFIENKYLKINLDSNGQVANMVLSNGIEISLNIQFYYYVSDDPERLRDPESLDKAKRPPGAYIFRPMDQSPILILKNPQTEVHKTNLVQEIHLKYSDFASIAIRVYKDVPTVELDWVVGPIPEDDGLGKDVFIRYTTDLDSKGVFYTDCNGRQTMKRIRDARATYVPVNTDRIPGNFFPVTSKIYIEDIEKNTRFTVFNDRSQGGTSLKDGQIDVMLHRRIFTDDSGIQAYINETHAGKGLIVRGTHYIYLTKADYKPNRIFEKKFAKEIELGPFVFTSTHCNKLKTDFNGWFDLKNEYQGLNKKLPVGVHVLTLEKWGDNILLRLENYLEKSDVIKNVAKTVFIKDMFNGFDIIGVKETYLAANVWIDELQPIKWNSERFYKNFNEAFGHLNGTVEYSDDASRTFDNINLEDGITLSPQQIRTFVVSYINK